MWCVVLVAVVAGLWAGTAHAAPNTQPGKPARPSTIIDPKSCVTTECHANVKASKVLHGPVSANTCDACHQLRDAKAHTFDIARQKSDLCTYCHEFNVTGMPAVHKPVTEGQCLGCHDPHGGRDHSFTREESVPALCGRCHESMTRDRKFVHAPVSKGECIACHPPHASKLPKLVDATGADLCLACHVDFDGRMGQVKSRHKAMDKGCNHCHDVHGSNHPMAIRKDAPDLCTQCHEKVKTQAETARHKHTVVMSGRSCMTCHTAHGSDTAKLMNDVPLRVCSRCHNQAIKTDGRTVAAVPEVSDPRLNRHGAMRDGECGGCHAAHGADRPMLLVKEYTKTLYKTFAPEQYELCFGCHDVRMVKEKATKTATQFRNGEANLHYVHVTQGELGRNCGMCHTPHASKNDRSVREWVQYKKWEMPVAFTRSTTGGSCTPGCHLPYAYDRQKPVAGPTTAPASQVAPVVARAERHKPPTIELIARDINVATVKVPAPGKPTLLVFVGPEQGEAVVKQVSAALPTSRPAQVIVIACGADADKHAKALAAAKGMAWPVLADAGGAMATDLEVRGWPTTLVLTDAGLEIARLNGASESLAYKLAPYLDLAAGKIDQDGLTKAMGQATVVSDGPEKQAARQARIIRHLLDDGNAEQAERLLDPMLAEQPQSLELRGLQVRALVQSRRAPQALTLLDQLPAGALANGEAEALRGAALIAMDRWGQAKEALGEAIKRNPELAEAHYLLGTVYEHEQDWPKAAAEYRAAHSIRRK